MSFDGACIASGSAETRQKIGSLSAKTDGRVHSAPGGACVVYLAQGAVNVVWRGGGRVVIPRLLVDIFRHGVVFSSLVVAAFAGLGCALVCVTFFFEGG